jgi:hypothetical protein
MTKHSSINVEAQVFRLQSMGRQGKSRSVLKRIAVEGIEEWLYGATPDPILEIGSEKFI